MVWVGATASGIANAVRRGDATAGEVVDAHLRALAPADDRLRAFREVRTVPALGEAGIVDDLPDLGGLALAGVPVAVKENTPIAGETRWYGSAAASLPPAEADHEVVRRLRGAGAVVLGSTRMPELGLFAVTDDGTGITRNPWDEERTPGGSSGGSAAAVAAGMVPLAHGNDGLGSLRIPAACCGLLGFKPGHGVVPADIGETDWFGMVENGVLATTVDDAALGFAVLADQVGRRYTTPPRLSVAVSLRSPVAGVFPDTAVRDAVGRVARLLVGAGHDARRADPRYPVGLVKATLARWFAGAYADAAPFERAELQRRTRWHAAIGSVAFGRGMVREQDATRWYDECLGFFERHDLLLTPVLAGPPPPARRWSERGWLANVITSTRYAPYAAPWNVAGLPALTVPAGTRPDGLPAAVQLVAPPGGEWLLLAVAAQIEAAAPWPRHAPGWPLDPA
ncbi:amidase [Actinocatenispora rupis]|uniref:Putative amidase AmiB2 n=1 Tax=Actinocatenispora rupis TaxID=519421 RepID=A0A8J3N8T0_9ACTN|nr:amidase family protein [Actinocatenispora rupis]GID10416.1 putative amidase AmiB2 [Actinocatenispora rupis]